MPMTEKTGSPDKMPAINDRPQGENRSPSRGEPVTEARADQSNALQGLAREKQGANEGVSLEDTPLEDNPKLLAELTAEFPEPNRGRPVVRIDAYGNRVIDHV
jgi:hypothetical protein